MLVYVDDILVTASNDLEVTDLIVKLNNIFALTDLEEVNYFLGSPAYRKRNSSLTRQIH